MIKRVLYALAALVVCQGTAVAKGPYEPSIRVGLWQGGAYTDDSTGDFSHCAASAPYNSGIVFFVSVNKNWGWTLGFAHDLWALTEGQTIPLDLTFDNRVKFRVVGSATRIGNAVNFVVVPMPDDFRLINAFRRALVMKAVAQGKTFGFNLDATSQLLPALSNCVSANAGGHEPSATPTLSSLKPDASSPEFAVPRPTDGSNSVGDQFHFEQSSAKSEGVEPSRHSAPMGVFWCSMEVR